MAGSDDPGRTGFAWVEFRRGDDEVFTVGARLRASASARKVETTLFTTTQAVGTELHLLDESREPLSGKALKAALGERGQVNSTAADHRNAIREVLFPGFSEDRYASVITALLALRKEKLSQNLDLVKLSEVLTDALPPIDEHELAAVAEGFERLDRRKEELRKLEAEVAAISALARRQRTYTRAVVAGVAHEVRGAESRRDAVTRAEREARAALDEAAGRDQTAEQELAVLIDRLEDIEVEVEARHASKAYRKGVELARAAHRGAPATRAGRTGPPRRGRAHGAQAARADELGEAEDQRRAAAGNLTVASDDVHQVASSLGADHLRQEMSDAADAEAGLAFGLAWAGARRQHISEVREAVRQHDEVVMHRRFEEQRLEEDRGAYDHTRDRSVRCPVGRAVGIGSLRRRPGGLGPGVPLRRHPGGGGRPGAPAVRTRSGRDGGQRAADGRPDQARGRGPGSRRCAPGDRRPAGVAARGAVQPRGRTQARPARPPCGGTSGERPTRGPAVAPGGAGARGGGGSDRRGGDRPGRLRAARMGGCRPMGWSTSQPTTWKLVPGGEGKAGQSTLADLLVPLTGAAVASGRVAAVLASIPVVPHVGPAATGTGPEVLMGTDGSFRLGSAVGRAPVRTSDPPRRRGPGAPATPTAVRGGRGPGAGGCRTRPGPTDPGRDRPGSTGGRGPSRRRSPIGASPPGRPGRGGGGPTGRRRRGPAEASAGRLRAAERHRYARRCGR